MGRRLGIVILFLARVVVCSERFEGEAVCMDAVVGYRFE